MFSFIFSVTMASSSHSRMSVLDPSFPDFVRKTLEELEEGEEGSDANDLDDENDPSYNSEHETASEQTHDSSESDKLERNKQRGESSSFYGRNRYKWSALEPQRNVKTPAHNLIIKVPTLKGPASRLGDSCSPLEAWECLFTRDMLEEIVNHTNVKISSYRSKFSDQQRTELRDMNVNELRALFGLLYFSAIFKSNHENLESMFATDGTGRDIFRATLSMKRVLILLYCLRFDDITSRDERKKNDPAAAISWIFNRMVYNSQASYNICSHACVDEMLVGFRGRCAFRVYMASKPAKYGLKIMILADAQTNYLLNAYLYTGKDSDGFGLTQEEKKFQKPTQSVLRLAKPIYGTNRNITADNYFGSIELVSELKERKLTYVGTLRKNKKEIPPEFQPSKRRAVGSTLYGFTNDRTLISYVPKKGKAVILISSMHHSKSTDPKTGKPEIISFYNSTKGGVDSLDQKCATYNTGRRTRRWPLAVFYAVLNIAGVNSYVIHTSCKKYIPIPRFAFIKTLARQLTEPYLNERLMNGRLSKELRITISGILKKPLPKSQISTLDSKRKRCALCPRASEKKTNQYCTCCSRPVCQTCRSVVCKECGEENAGDY